ncbi:MAG: HesB/IscA family protein [Alphaproteobacteria bacterium]
MPGPAITLTDAAAARIKELMAKSDEPVAGLRVGVKPRGCSGLSYTMEYATESQPHEEVVEDKGVKIFIHPMAIMFLVGTEMDYRDSGMGGASFVFKNPNEKDRCGCGESFRV